MAGKGLSQDAAPNRFALRVATEADLPRLSTLMDLAIEQLQRGFLSEREIEASRAVMGLDTQLVADRSYFAVLDGAKIVGCGGWSRRATLYGGDHSSALREPRLLDPQTEAARVRAMYTHPDHARRGIGRLVLDQCETAAQSAGFSRAELMATLSGVPLYRACGYREIEPVFAEVGMIRVPLIRMAKSLH